jgi:hypothetical protein
MRLAFVNMLETLTILVGTPNRELVLGELVDTLG